MLYRPCSTVYRANQEGSYGPAVPHSSENVDRFSRRMVGALEGEETISDAWERVVKSAFVPGKLLTLEGQIESRPQKGIQELGVFRVLATDEIRNHEWQGILHRDARVKLVHVEGPPLAGETSIGSEFYLWVYFVQAADGEGLPEGGPQCFTMTGEGVEDPASMARSRRHGAYNGRLFPIGSQDPIAEVCSGIPLPLFDLPMAAKTAVQFKRLADRARDKYWAPPASPGEPGGGGYEMKRDGAEALGFAKRSRRLESQRLKRRHSPY